MRTPNRNGLAIGNANKSIPAVVSVFRRLWFQVLIAMLLGAALGALAPDLGERMKPLGDGFIRLVRMIIAPIVFCSVVHGIAAMNDMKRAGRVAIKALIYFELITTLALILGLVAANVSKPGAGMHIDVGTIDARGVEAYTSKSSSSNNASDFVLNIIPNTFVGAFTQGDVLPVLLLSVLFAFALTLMRERGKPVLDLVESISEILFRIVGYIMKVAPLGAFGAIAFTVGRFGSESLLSLGALIFQFYTVCLLFVFGILGAIAYWVGVNLLRLLSYLREEIVIVAATTSTESVLPQLMQKLRKLGCAESVVGLVVPTGYSFNLDGTCLYLVTVTLFLAQATDTSLTLSQQISLLVVLLIVSKGAAGVAGAALVVLAATLSSGPIPVASIALVVGIHRLLAEALTFVNLIGNSVATIVVAKWEGAMDEQVLQEKVGIR
jgi:aerobic C4-dicarboxylate transport protein